MKHNTKGVKWMGNDTFADFEKLRLEILERKIQGGIDEIKANRGQQWTQIRFEKPLLETLLNLIEQVETLELAQEKIKAMAEYIANGIEMGYIDDREGDYKKLV